MVLKNSRLKKYAPHSYDFSLRSCPSIQVGRAANNNVPEPQISEYLRIRLKDNKSVKPRKADKRLWESLSEDQFRAAQQIYFGFKMRVVGTGFRTQIFSALPPTACMAHHGPSDLLEKFSIWSRVAHEAGISVGSILDILVFGQSCRAVDRVQKRRKGFARKNLKAGLDCFLNLPG